VREKANPLEVIEPAKAMGRFESLMGRLAKIPKGELKAKHKRAKARQKAESQSGRGADAQMVILRTEVR